MKRSAFLTCVSSVLLLFSCSSTEKQAQIPVSEMSEEPVHVYAKELAQKLILVDGHVDLPYRMEVKGFMLTKKVEDVSVETEGNFDYPKSKAGGLDAPFMSIYIPSKYQKIGGAKAFADSLIDMVSRLPVAFPDLFALATSPSDIEQNFEKGLISLPLGMENGAPIENKLSNVEYFYHRGIRYITLTHSRDNQICDSSYDKTDDTWNGLSPFGEEVVKEMNRLGMMIDISHVTDSAFYDALTISKAPLIASHSSCRKFTPDFIRNMTDQMIIDLAAKGGVIHINFGSTFLSKRVRDIRDEMSEHLKNWQLEKGLSDKDSLYKAYAKQYAEKVDAYSDVPTVADHIDNVVQLAGIDYVALGSDFDGVGDSLPKGLKDVSMYPNLIAELLKRGYSEEDIAKICYKNTFRVWRAVEETARQLQSS